MKVFDLILSHRIKLQDDLGITYEIYTNKYDDEFLHVESFVFKPALTSSYISDALLSNENLPCKEYLNFNEKTHTMLCKGQGYFGAIECIPCKRCFDINFDLLKEYTDSFFIGYCPDIAFGYNGKHKIWIEINDTNPCSYFKQRYCSRNDIVLLEVDAKDFDLKKDYNIIQCKNLSYNRDNTYLRDELIRNLLKDIGQQGYSLKKKFSDSYKITYENEDFYFHDDILIKLLDNLGLTILSYYSKEAKEYFNLNIEGFPHLIITKEKYNDFDQFYKNYYKQIQQIKLKELLVTSFINEMNILNNIENNGYSLYQPYAKHIINWDNFLNKNKLQVLTTKKEKEQLGIFECKKYVVTRII